MSSQLFPKRPNQDPTITQTPVPVPSPELQVNQSFVTNESQYAGSRGGNNKKILFIFIVVILLLGISGVVYAYLSGKISLFKKAPYDTNRLAMSIMEGLSKIDTAKYTFKIDINSGPKDPDAESYKNSVSIDKEKEEAYKRDQDIVRDLKTIVSGLSTYYLKEKNYPPRISLLKDNIPLANSKFVYVPKSDLSDFFLTAEFETNEAVLYINKTLSKYSKTPTVVNGKKISLTKEHSQYYYLSLPEQIPQPFVSNLSSLQSMLAYIPGDFAFSGKVVGLSEKTLEKKINSHLTLDVSTKLSGMDIVANIELKKIGETFYVLIKDLPPILIDTSKLKDKWIEITSKDALEYGGSYTSSLQDRDMTDLKSRSIEFMTRILEVADRNKVLIAVGEPVKETVNGSGAYRYNLKLNRAVLAQFYTDLTSELDKIYGDNNTIKYDKAIFDYINSKDFDNAYEYLSKNVDLVLWANSDGIPVQIQSSIRVVPDSTAKNSDKQIKLVLTINIDEINKKISITAPNESISIEDASIMMTGQSKELYRMNKQIGSIQNIRFALDDYKNLYKKYPDTLDQLLGAKSKYGSYLMKTIPVDVNTGEQFLYNNHSQGLDYYLVYNIQLPTYKPGTSVRSIYDVSYFGSDPKITIKAVNGKNTADSKSLSREAETASRLDTDGDKLPDVIEKYIGTNINKKDTDGDGYTDYSEVESGTNPLGPGKLSP